MTDWTLTTSNRYPKAEQAARGTYASSERAQTGPSVETQTTPSNETAVQSNALAEYNWPGKHKPFAHQKQTAEFLAVNRKAFCFNEVGTGKTASVIWASDFLMNMGLVRRVLVICPLSVMKSAWQADLFKFAIHRTCDVAYGAATQRRKIIAQGADYVIINYDGVEIVKDEILNGGFDLIVADEAGAYKNVRTTRWKTLKEIHKKIKGLWMLTGTPAAQSPVDAYGLAKLVNPDNTPKLYGTFRDMVLIQVSQYKWVPKANAKHIVHRVLQPAIRFEKSQCIDLPDVTYVERDAPLTPQQEVYYAQLKAQLVIEAGGEQVSAINAAVGINKLLQISGGAVYSDSGEVIDFDVSNRLKVVHEIIEEASHKVLVFVPFTHTIELLKNYLETHHIKAEVINGQVNMHRRHDIIARFQKNDDTQVLIIQPQAAAHGITLTAANVIIWYAPVTSVETYLQANARINRPGQKNPMTVVHVTGSEVEDKLYKALQSNVDGHMKIVDLYKQEILKTT